MPWGYAIAAVATYAGSKESSKGAKAAGKAGADASRLSVEEQQREYDQSRKDMLPFLQFGQSAIPLQQAFLNGDFSGFENSPDYKYALQQGINSLDSSAAARGGLFGGGADKDRMRFASGLATQNADNYWNKLAGISGQGQTSASTLGQLGQSTANGISNAYQFGGNARASAYQNQANANANMWNNFGQIGAAYFGNRNGYGG